MYFKAVGFLIWCCYSFTFGLDPCENHKKCDQCISDPNNCIWCAKDNIDDFRCKSIYEKSWCPNHRINPTSSINKTDDRSFSSDLGKSVQIKPQRYKIQLRIGQKIDFNFSYEAAKNYPVDIYFLVDASLSMQDIRTWTADQSESIYFTLSNLTSNVFLGLGTFVDKNAIPFSSIIDSERSYSFIHRLNLTEDFETFKTILKDAPAGQSFDEPEGGLDALGQVMTCKEEIGWREQSRKIIVLLTDGSYHAAGDGIQGGITRPYDGKCYTRNGVYLNEINMDYPSAGIISKLAKDEQMIIVFAVKQGIQNVYKKLSNSVRDSWSTTYDSDDMAKILKTIYEKITQRIKFDIKSEYRKNIEVKFEPDCFVNTSDSCIVHKGQEMNFVGSIKLLCDVEKDNFLVDVMIGGIKENLTLDIDVIKRCNCETDIKSEECNSFGNRRCGICECSPGRYGAKCECTATSRNTVNNTNSCTAPGDDKVCSGHGLCHCGSCNCNQRRNGRFCECDQDSCPRDASGATCNGHGNCVCGVCTCTSADWSGDACDCYKPTTPCIVDGKLCNNRGKCNCGSCRCAPIAQWDARYYQDKFCRVMHNPDCHSRQCELLLSCAQCHHSGNGNCSQCHSDVDVNVTKTLSDVNVTVAPWNLCLFKTNGICYSRFAYRYDDDNYSLQLVVQTDNDCAESYYMFGGLFLLALILIGVATLVAWKLVTDARDRHEYERFQKQRDEDMSETRCNPGFKPSTMMFSNPAFRKRSVHN
ncbi:unnamed protein product, partial [Iphiclides podalirius]